MKFQVGNKVTWGAGSAGKVIRIAPKNPTQPYLVEPHGGYCSRWFAGHELELANAGDDKPKPRPEDPFDKVLEEIQALNRRKRSDYASDQDPFQNFRDSGYQIGQPAGVSVETLIATKQSRLRQLLSVGREPTNESVEDTLLDRAVYSIIALAMYRQGLYQEEK